MGEVWESVITSFSMRRSSVSVLGGVGVRSLRSRERVWVDEEEEEEELYLVS